MLDVTDDILAQYQKKKITKLVETLPASAHPQAALMFAKLAANHAERIDRESPNEYYDRSHAANFQALAECLSRRVDPGIYTSFEEAERPDPHVKTLFSYALYDEENLHQLACITHGLRRHIYDENADRFHMVLTKRRRKSLLLALNSAAQFDLLDSETGGLIDFDSNDEAYGDAKYFALASSIEHLKYVTRPHPESWKKFEESIGITADNIAVFSGFIFYLVFAAKEAGHSLWYSKELLVRLADVFRASYPDVYFPDELALDLIGKFSLTPHEASEFLLPTPFFKYGEKYLRYHGFHNIMPSAMGLLTIAIRKNEAAWSRTVGSTSAYAADLIAASLSGFVNIRLAVRRNLKGKGDVDLAIYDITSESLLLCEVKTVYDKHNMMRLMHRFEQAKVNLRKAIGQLRLTIDTINSGETSMEAIFGEKLPPPTEVKGALLTWLDPVDLTIGTSNEDLFSFNFATLCYLLKVSDGSLRKALITAHECRNIWFVSIRKPIDLGIEVPTDIETQTQFLDSASELDKLNLSSLTKELHENFPSLPEGWRSQTEMSDYVSYIQDTKNSLAESV